MKVSELLNETSWKSEPGLKPEDAAFIKIFSSGQRRAVRMKGMSPQGFAYVTNRKVTPTKLPFDFSNLDMPYCNVFGEDTEYYPTMQGFPKTVNIFRIKGIIGNRSYIGVPMVCKTLCLLNGINVYSLAGIGKDYCVETKGLFINPLIKSNMLGILKIKGLQTIEKIYIGAFSMPKFDKAFKIIEKHLHGHRDIMECQEELIDNDLKDFAEL